MTTRHRRFAIHDVTFGGVSLPGATVDCWDDSDGHSRWSARIVTRVGPDRAYSELERGIADLLTAQVAIALQNADLHARVAESALRDPLTGLLNRRFFDEAVDGDTVVRYGGEEFVVIAPGTDGDGAVLAAERIRDAVAASGEEAVDGRGS